MIDYLISDQLKKFVKKELYFESYEFYIFLWILLDFF